MKYVDLIIQYLSGDLSEDESSSFRKELETNPLLREEFEQVSAAYRLIRDQIQKDDLEHFTSRLREVMERPVKGQTARVRYRKWLFPIPVAAALAILILLFTTNRDQGRIFSRYYQPERDPVVLAFNQDARGETEMGIALYNRERYERSRQVMAGLLETDPENQLALLYYLLSSIELDLEEEAIQAVRNTDVRTDHPLGQSLAWYTAMACIKSGRYEQAGAYLMPLKQQQGPYEQKAGRLIKLLQRRFSSP